MNLYPLDEDDSEPHEPGQHDYMKGKIEQGGPAMLYEHSNPDGYPVGGQDEQDA
ncbi:hypothetical protein [uncultured Corynebacterium sp.]|uniref:hypothetical protein n=1 Tax=uncultured Corynebacterium sp. TaxID=159447 RepID=UPI0025D4CB46|nr:hypothetical protein [uncultured Corynebacterium sp.]